MKYAQLLAFSPALMIRVGMISLSCQSSIGSLKLRSEKGQCWGRKQAPRSAGLLAVTVAKNVPNVPVDGPREATILPALMDGVRTESVLGHNNHYAQQSVSRWAMTTSHAKSKSRLPAVTNEVCNGPILGLCRRSTHK